MPSSLFSLTYLHVRDDISSRILHLFILRVLYNRLRARCWSAIILFDVFFDAP